MREITRVLISARTYPELSTNHRETVCTAGCDEDGSPVRLYPVHFRYLPAFQQYELWDWVEASLVVNPRDNRPESRKLGSQNITPIKKVDTGKDRSWAERRSVIYRDPSWHFECVRDLEADQKTSGRSLGFVKVGAVDRVWIEHRPEADREKHEEKLESLKSQTDLFGLKQKDLEFYGDRIRVSWRCARLKGPQACTGHNAAVLDWGIGQLARRDGAAAAKARMEELANLDEYDLHFFMGNFRQFPQSFGIVGLWFPKHKYLKQADLFIPQ